MKAKLKILRIQDGNEPELILRNMLQEEQKPYLFRVGDQIEISDGSEIITHRRNGTISKVAVPSIEWFEQRLKELHWKIQNSLNNDSFVSQSDVYERNYLLEIYNELKKDAENS